MSQALPTSRQLWIEGARLRTLPAAVAPVVVGSAAAAHGGGFVGWKAFLALGVSLALQIGVNFANDYSDGIRGTDADRVGPLRLVGSGLVPPHRVKAAAFACFGIGALLGLILAVTSGWWLLLIGAAAIGAAWTYTGGKNPYGYRALGELSVFVFFGLVAVLGTTYVQLGGINWPAVTGSIGIGALACAILVANNLRDIDGDREVGKRTMAVVLGDAGTRRAYVALLLTAAVATIATVPVTPWALFSLTFGAVAWESATSVLRGARGRDLIDVLKNTGLAELLWAIGFAAGLLIAS